MGKMYMIFTMLSLAMFSFSCYENNNPLDENGTNYLPPKITINEDASSVKNLATVHFDSIVIVLEGNHERSLFNLKMDDGEWAKEWKSEGTFGFGRLSDGKHTMYINSMYREGNIVVSDSLVFHVLTKGYKPEFTATKDTTITLLEGNSVTLSVQAEGRSPLNYSWLKGSSVLEGKVADTLKIASFSVNDSASYQCIVTNEYGTATSRTFILKYRPFSGEVKGIVTDSAGNKLENASVTLLPPNKNNSTDTAGFFEFSSLSANSYTLKISLSKYHDTTLSGIAVNDTSTVELKTIKLKMVDTTTFKVTYDGNGNDSGTVPSDTTKYLPGRKIVVAGISNLSKIGYSFSKWNTKKDGTGDAVSARDSFTVNGNITFFAQWIVRQYTLSFNGNGSTSGEVPEQKHYDYQKSIIIPDNGSLERAGYSFTRWNTKKDGSGKGYAADDTLLMPGSDVELFAQWKALTTYKITYNKNEADTGTVPVDNNSYYNGKEVTVAGNPGNLYRDGYSFSGWNTKADMTGDTYNAGAKFAMLDSALTLYAKWTTNPTYSIIYHSATSTGGNVPATVNADSGMQVTIADSGSLYKTGYTFVGWNTKEDGSGKAYKTGDKVVMDTVNIELYAQWTKAQYTITYHGNGNTGGPVPPVTTHLYQSEASIPSNEPSRTGHTFTGWNTDSTGKGIDYHAGDKILVEKNVHLYARWIKKKYQITFSGNGERASDIPLVTEFEYGAKIDSSFFVSSRESYIFDGWFMDSLCINKWKYKLDSVVSNDTLYSKWVIKDADGNIYTEVKIGNQVWMVENLKVTSYRDGTPIPRAVNTAEWTSITSAGFCWYENDSAKYNAIYGALYNWFTIKATNQKQLSPSGWHIPSDSEWTALENHLISNGYNWDGSTTGNKIGKALAAKTNWTLSDVEGYGYVGNNTATNNLSGFTGIPGGCRNSDGSFSYLGYRSLWWSTTEFNSSYAWYRCIFYDNYKLYRDNSFGRTGYSIRCIRDW